MVPTMLERCAAVASDSTAVLDRMIGRTAIVATVPPVEMVDSHLLRAVDDQRRNAMVTVDRGLCNLHRAVKSRATKTSML